MSARLHARVADSIGARIVSGALAPGSLLEGEIEASARLAVSRSAYREAIRMLAAKGLVRARPRYGTEVSPRANWHLLDPQVLAWSFSSDPAVELIHQIFELRHMVEPDAARLAAERRTPEQLAEMEAGLAAMQRWGWEPEGNEGDLRFHRALLDASGNAFLVSLTSGVSAAVALTVQFSHDKLADPRDALADHVAVFEAIRDRNGQAAHDSMRLLIDLALKDTLAARGAVEGSVGNA